MVNRKTKQRISTIKGTPSYANHRIYEEIVTNITTRNSERKDMNREYCILFSLQQTAFNFNVIRLVIMKY
jgi:hypothetical protein